MTIRIENIINQRPRATPPTEQNFINFSTPLSLIGTEGEIYDLKEYLFVVETFIETGTGQFHERIDNAVKAQKLSEQESEEYYVFHQDEYERWHSSFPNTIRSTVLIAACSRFETALANLCKGIEKQKFPDLCGWDSMTEYKGIRRGEYFLRINIGVCLREHPLWSRVIDYYTIRDCFVHAGGDISMMSERSRIKISDAIKGLKRFGISENAVNQIELSREFIAFVLADMIEFWKDLGKAIKHNAVVGPQFFP